MFAPDTVYRHVLLQRYGKIHREQVKKNLSFIWKNFLFSMWTKIQSHDSCFS